MKLSQQLAAKISGEHQVEAATAAQIVDLVLNGIAEAVAAGNELNLIGVGTLRTEVVSQRQDYNPSTGVAMPIPASARLVFDPLS